MVCKELGYYHMVRYESGIKFQELQAGLEIELDDLSCPESEWGSCSYRDGSHNCQHSEDIFLTCTGEFNLTNHTFNIRHLFKPSLNQSAFAP